MDDLNYNVAVNLKRIRREKGMSLEGMAEQTGVSKSMLAQIEKGIANPSLGVIGKIIGGLHLEFQELIEDVFCLEMDRQHSYRNDTAKRISLICFFPDCHKRY